MGVLLMGASGSSSSGSWPGWNKIVVFKKQTPGLRPEKQDEGEKNHEHGNAKYIFDGVVGMERDTIQGNAIRYKGGWYKLLHTIFTIAFCPSRHAGYGRGNSCTDLGDADLDICLFYVFCSAVLHESRSQNQGCAGAGDTLMERKTIRLLFVAILLLFSSVELSASGSEEIEHSGANITDTASLQRGAKWFMNYCLSCHSVSYMRYNRMAQDLGLSEEMVMENLVFADAKFGDTMEISMRPDHAESWFGNTPRGSLADRSIPWRRLDFCLSSWILHG